MGTLRGNPIAYRSLFAALAGPALLLGAAPAAAQEPTQTRTSRSSEPPPEALYQNPGMRTAGMAITGLAIATGVVSLGAWAYGAGCNTRANSSCGAEGAVVGFFGMPISFVLSIIGVPLWAVGAAAPSDPVLRTAPRWVPADVAVGPGSASFQWTF